MCGAPRHRRAQSSSTPGGCHPMVPEQYSWRGRRNVSEGHKCSWPLEQPSHWNRWFGSHRSCERRRASGGGHVRERDALEVAGGEAAEGGDAGGGGGEEAGAMAIAAEAQAARGGVVVAPWSADGGAADEIGDLQRGEDGDEQVPVVGGDFYIHRRWSTGCCFFSLTWPCL